MIKTRFFRSKSIPKTSVCVCVYRSSREFINFDGPDAQAAGPLNLSSTRGPVRARRAED